MGVATAGLGAAAIGQMVGGGACPATRPCNVRVAVLRSSIQSFWLQTPCQRDPSRRVCCGLIGQGDGQPRCPQRCPCWTPVRSTTGSSYSQGLPNQIWRRNIDGNVKSCWVSWQYILFSTIVKYQLTVKSKCDQWTIRDHWPKSQLFLIFWESTARITKVTANQHRMQLQCKTQCCYKHVLAATCTLPSYTH